MAKSRKKELRFRLWVDLNGERFFGPGRAELLQLIEETGSIAKAARAMKMSYKKAWAMVSDMNERAVAPLVIVQKGGAHGGGTDLTPQGKMILKSYDRLLSKITGIVDKDKSLLDLI